MIIIGRLVTFSFAERFQITLLILGESRSPVISHIALCSSESGNSIDKLNVFMPSDSVSDAVQYCDSR